MDIKFVDKIIHKYLKHSNITNNLYVEIIHIAVYFNLSKGEISDKHEIIKLINMMDAKEFATLKQTELATQEDIKHLIRSFAEQFSYTNKINKILCAYTDAYFAHLKVNEFQYFFKQDKLDEVQQKINVDLLANFLDKSRQLNEVIIEALKYNYSFIIEYARDSLKRA